MKLSRLILAGTLSLACLGPLIGAARWAMRFQDHVTLPNGMALERNFDFTRSGRHDLVAPQGGMILARDVQFVCFNDQYVWADARAPEPSGFYDATSNRGLAGSRDPEAFTESSLIGPGGCNGYYTAMLGPGLLYEGNKPPFLPACASRNMSNPVLRHRDWFERPCNP